MKIMAAFAIVVMLSGCAGYSQVLINAEGHEAYCDSMGAGLFGAAAAGNFYDSCINSRRAAGYIEIEKVGAVGATFNDEGYVLRLVPRGPAATGGLKLNDQVIAVNGIATNTGKELHALLFVPVGTRIALKVKRDGADQEIVIASESWSHINGFKPLKGPAPN